MLTSPLTTRLTRRLGLAIGLFSGLALALAVVAVSFGVLSRPAQAIDPGVGEPWPAFVMVYRDAARVEPSGRMVTQVFRLEYSDARHFRTTLLQHSDDPSVVGYTQVFDGTVSTTHDPRLGSVASRTYRPDEWTVPADWLVPRKTPALQLRPDALLNAGPSTATVTAKYMQGAHAIIEEITYRIADGIPTLYVIRVDGSETRRTEVLELTVGR